MLQEEPAIVVRIVRDEQQFELVALLPFNFCTLIDARLLVSRKAARVSQEVFRAVCASEAPAHLILGLVAHEVGGVSLAVSACFEIEIYVVRLAPSLRLVCLVAKALGGVVGQGTEGCDLS